jgi:hypothetical protein
MSRLNSFVITALLSIGINILLVLPTYAETLSWDIDNDGNTDALTDGLLLLRFSFGLTGDSLTSGTISAGSNLSPSEVETKLNATQAIADIDGNGEVDALTDGILLLRYLFDVSGDSLIDGVISTNATRNTISAISEYIAQYFPIHRLSAKRGIGYGTGGGQQELSIEDLSLIDERMTWFYNWGRSPFESISGIYPSHNIDYTPMLWGRNSSEDEVRQFLDNSPNTKYLLGFNEPTHLHQANMTPQEAASLWPILEGIADDYNLKLVSPAVGNSSLYSAWDYLDAFFEACTDCRVDYIAVHKYGKDTENFKTFIRESYQYGKPVWVTEYAGAGGYNGSGWPNTADDHIEFLANTTRWLESEVNVYRYAWFVGRSGIGINNWPYNSLLGEDGATTALGELYFSIPSTNYLYQTGVKIPAVGANNLAYIDYTEISDGDNIIATTADTSGSSYLEFDFDIQKAQTYTFEIRAASPSNGLIKLSKEQLTLQLLQNISTGTNPNWQTIVSDSFQLDSGKNTLRLEVGSNIAINSVKLVTSENSSEPESTTNITIGESPAFSLRDDSMWTHVIPLTYLSDGASSQGTQTLSINITELPQGGAGYRVIRTNANGFWFSANRQELVLGNNVISVASESFERHVRLQFSNPNIRFDTLSVNEVQLYPETAPTETAVNTPITVGESPAFANTNNDLWTKVITLSLASQGSSSQAAQTLAINITELPATGANYRVYKTTANGNDFMGNSQVLVLGENNISVTSVTFDRTVKIQFSSPDVKFDSLFVNGTKL